MASALFPLLCALAIVSVHGASFKDEVTECKSITKYQPERSARDSREAKCFAACIMEKKGMATADGSILQEKLLTEYTKRLTDRPEKVQQMRTILSDCKTQASKLSDKCDKVFSFKECSAKKARDTKIFSRHPPPEI